MQALAEGYNIQQSVFQISVFFKKENNNSLLLHRVAGNEKKKKCHFKKLAIIINKFSPWSVTTKSEWILNMSCSFAIKKQLLLTDNIKYLAMCYTPAFRTYSLIYSLVLSLHKHLLTAHYEYSVLLGYLLIQK